MIFRVDALPGEIVIGKQTEAGVMSVGFDCSPWLEKWPGMMLHVWVTPPGQSGAYPAIARVEGSVAYWDVNASDTAVDGIGAVEIVGLLADKKKLSATVHTKILPSFTAQPGEAPDPAKPWVDSVLNAAYRAEEAARDAAAAADRAESAGGGLDFGPENAGQLLYVGADGKAIPLQLGDGLEIVDGMLRVTYQPGPDVPADKSIVFAQQENGDVLMSGVTFVQQPDGAVLWHGADLTMRDDGVLIN